MLSTAHPELGGVDFDLAVEDDVFPLDWADVPDGFGIEREVGRGGDPGDLPGLSVDDAGEDQRQARTRVHLVVDLTSADAAPVAVVHGARQGVELFDLQEPRAHLGAQLRLGHVLQY